MSVNHDASQPDTVLFLWIVPWTKVEMFRDDDSALSFGVAFVLDRPATASVAQQQSARTGMTATNRICLNAEGQFRRPIRSRASPAASLRGSATPIGSTSRGSIRTGCGSPAAGITAYRRGFQCG